MGCAACFAATGQYNRFGCSYGGRRRRDNTQQEEGLDANATFAAVDNSGDGSINMEEAVGNK
jgi:hypothetical protein